jgi:hypothetical protein
MFDPYSGITNNLSESMNAVLKREQDWKELPVDFPTLGSQALVSFKKYIPPPRPRKLYGRRNVFFKMFQNIRCPL